MVRSVLGVVLGVVAWMVGFWVLATLLTLLWPDYAIHGRRWIREGVFTFTPLMASLNLVLWVLAELGAGWVAARIANRRAAACLLARLLRVYLAVLHFMLYWPAFPWWYTIGVVTPVV